LVIAAIAFVVIGVTAYMLSQPRKGTVEWHRRGYLRAGGQIFEVSLMDRFTQFVHEFTGVPSNGDGEEEVFDLHMRFLVATGVLISTEFTIQNEDWVQVATNAFNEAKVRIPPERGRYWYVTGKEKSLWVVSLPEDVSVWKELIKKWDN
jgi:hypothetical protein